MKAFFLFFLLICFHKSVPCQILYGKVVGITDGDTFTLLSLDKKQTKIRLHGIDCPERGQDFSTVAKQRLSDLIYLKTVKVEIMDLDHYGRTIGMLFVGSRNVNEILLSEGLAWHFTKYDQKVTWHELQVQAQLKKIGIWSILNPTPPWDFRKIKR